MKSLYESILGSTKSGAYELIKKWCDKVFSRGNLDNVEHGYMIDANLHITNWTNGKSNNALYVNSSYDEKVPDYIKFSKEINANFFIGQLLNLIDHKNLPKKVERLYISGKTKKIPSFKMECTHGFSINEYAHMIEHIDPIEIHCESAGFQKPIIDLDYTKIEIQDIKNITVTGEVYRLKIQKTPAADAILKTVKKLDKKQEKLGGLQPGEKPAYQEYLDELFSNLPNLRYVELSTRTNLEHNPKTNLWYIF